MEENKKKPPRRHLFSIAGKGVFRPSETLPEEKRAVMRRLIDERKAALDALAKY